MALKAKGKRMKTTIFAHYLMLALLVLITGCSPLVVVVQPTSQPTQGTIITAASITIEREEGSGAVCTANATYFVHASITADGPATAAYEILSSAGQIAAGNYENSQGVSPAVSGTLTFAQAETKTINLRFVGPYPYPADITVILRVNGGEFHNTKLSCQ